MFLKGTRGLLPSQKNTQNSAYRLRTILHSESTEKIKLLTSSIFYRNNLLTILQGPGWGKSAAAVIKEEVAGKPHLSGDQIVFLYIDLQAGIMRGVDEK